MSELPGLVLNFSVDTTRATTALCDLSEAAARAAAAGGFFRRYILDDPPTIADLEYAHNLSLSPDAYSVKLSDLTAEAEAEMAEWDAILLRPDAT